ncbi:MAG: serine/threonine-protein kinase [Kofleriaceae bacterium]
MITDPGRQAIVIGRYLLHRQIARGGMATIHIARLVGDEGFTRIVAAKRLHPEFAEDAEFVGMFLDEARIASKVHHRNVVPVLDVVTTGEEVVLVQEYVHGVPLHWLLRTAHEAKTHIPINIAVSIACQVLAGLQAAHETTDELGVPLGVVHRDVSPQNVMVATDGTARLLDFGIAKATMAAHITREGMFKGKLAYSAPEQIRGQATQQSDIYSLTIVLWELIVGHRLHNSAQSEAELIGEVMNGKLPTITEVLAPEREWLGANRWKQLEMLEPIIQRGLSVDMSKRWTTAAEMEAALASAVQPATTTGVAGWLKTLGKEFLSGRDRVIALEEASWRRLASAPSADTGPLGTLARGRIPRRMSHAGVLATEPGTQTPIPILTRSRTRLFATLAIAGFLLVLGFIIWITRDPGGEPAATAAELPKPAAAPAPAPVAEPAITPRPRDATVAPIPAVAIEPAAPASAVGSGLGTGEATAAKMAPPVRAPANPARNRVVSRPAQRQLQRDPPQQQPPQKATPAPTPPPTQKAATTAPAPEPAKPDCNPPYYFDGAKKVFKPACL